MTRRKRSIRPLNSPETSVAAEVVRWLKNPSSHNGGWDDDAWEVYQEVDAPGGRCDIVAERKGTVWAIEVKVRMSLALVEQAVHWIPYAHRVSIAAGFIKTRQAYQHRELLGRLGLGLIAVPLPGYYKEGAYQPILPALQSADHVGMILQRLVPQQKENTAGSKGGYWTKYKESCGLVLRYVIDHPGCTLKELVEALGKLHYSSVGSARQTLRQRVESRSVPGVWVDPSGKLWHAPLDSSPKLSRLPL